MIIITEDLLKQFLVAIASAGHDGGDWSRCSLCKVYQDLDKLIPNQQGTA